MLLEVGSHRIENKGKYIQRVCTSERDRERIIRLYEGRLDQAPRHADTALVLGTSPTIFPDKFAKRVYTGSWLVQQGLVDFVIFSGKSDDETKDTDQAQDAKIMAVQKFGLDESRILTVGGDNTKENLELAYDLLGERKGTSNMFLVSDGAHLLRTMSLASHLFKCINVTPHPYPILNERAIHRQDPVVIMEAVKTIAYNRLLNKTSKPVPNAQQEQIDRFIYEVKQSIASMPRIPQVGFAQWRREVEGSESHKPLSFSIPVDIQDSLQVDFR